MKGAGKFEGSSSKIVFEDSEEDEDLSCSSVSSSDEVSSFRIGMELKYIIIVC
jgi:ribosomal RNA-processing protein 36